MSLPTLYGLSTNGKVKEWNISILQMGDGTCYIETKHGYEGGKKQLDQRLVAEGKNIGRANETSPYEQALSEARSSHSRKRDSGYVEDKHSIPAEDSGMFLPMLAHSYSKHGKKINFPCWVQPKLDGVRMLARKEGGVVTMWSRKGKVIDIPDKINHQLCDMLSEGQCTDGELYVHGWTFQRIISAVKKKRKDTDLLEYHIYDSPHEGLLFEDRIVNNGEGYHSDSEISAPPDGNGDAPFGFAPVPSGVHFPKHCQSWSIIGDRIKLVETYSSSSREEFDLYEKSMIKDGYEGMMARNKGSLYKFKNRSYDLQKVKRFLDGEYQIVGGKDGSGRESGLIIYRCITIEGNIFDVRPRGSHEERREAFNNLEEYKGKMLTVRYQELTDDGIPRFPVGIAVRDYE